MANLDILLRHSYWAFTSQRVPPPPLSECRCSRRQHRQGVIPTLPLCGIGPSSQLQHAAKAATAADVLSSTHAPVGTTAGSKVSNSHQQLHEEPIQVLKLLARYTPTGLSDGPVSLSQVRPYNAEEVQQALQDGVEQLHSFTLPQLSNIAAALAAAGHSDPAFMMQLGSEAAHQLQAAQMPSEHAAALADVKMICFLAMAFARLGIVHNNMLQGIAVKGTQLLSRHQLLHPSKRIHGQHLALLAAAFAALSIHPPQLFRAMAELLKQKRHVLQLLGPRESMLMLWAFTRLQHKDPPAHLLLLQRATSQVGQLDCQGLAHAYSQCAEVGLSAPPLLAALRKASRQRLHSMQPQHLTTILTSLASLALQDLLLLDELSRALVNKMANCTAAQISICFTACSMLRYRNMSLLDKASKMLVSRKLRKSEQFTPGQLLDIAAASGRLRYSNSILLDHLGFVAANTLVGSWSADDVACVLQRYSLLGFHHPQLLQAAAARLQQLTTSTPYSQRNIVQLITAMYHIVHMPAVGLNADRSVVAMLMQSIATTAVDQGSCGRSDLIRLAVALLLSGCCAADVQPAACQHSQSAAVRIALMQRLQQLLAGVHNVSELVALGPDLLKLMQLLWLAQVEQLRIQPANQTKGQQHLQQVQEQQQQQHKQDQWQQQQWDWRLGLPQQLLAAYLGAQQALTQQQLLQQQGSLQLKALVSAVQRQLPGCEVQMLYAVSDSPILLPAAVLPATHAAASHHQQQTGLFAYVPLVMRRGTQLPKDVLDMLKDCQAFGRPVAVSLTAKEGMCIGGLSSWYTSNAPRQLLPLADCWRRGLLAAGWAVLLLDNEEQQDHRQ